MRVLLENIVCPLIFSKCLGEEEHYLMYRASHGFMKLRIDYFNIQKELKLLIMNSRPTDCFLTIMRSNPLLRNPVKEECLLKILGEIELNLLEFQYPLKEAEK